MKKENKMALIRMGIALVLAMVLLAVTGFGFIPLLAGPVEVADGQELEGQRYVSADLEHVMTLCGEEVKGETVVAYYAIAPIGNRFVTLRFDAALKGDIEQMVEATTAYLGGESRVMTVHMPIKGMVKEAGDDVYALLSQWFEANKDWMAAAGVVGPEPVEEEYLAAELIRVDELGSLKGSTTVALSAVAALLVLYALVELCFVAFGGKKENKAENKEKPVKAAPAEEKAGEPAVEETEEPVTEEAAEADKAEETDETEAVEEVNEEAEEAKEEEENA